MSRLRLLLACVLAVLLMLEPLRLPDPALADDAAFSGKGSVYDQEFVIESAGGFSVRIRASGSSPVGKHGPQIGVHVKSPQPLGGFWTYSSNVLLPAETQIDETAEIAYPAGAYLLSVFATSWTEWSVEIVDHPIADETGLSVMIPRGLPTGLVEMDGCGFAPSEGIDITQDGRRAGDSQADEIGCFRAQAAYQQPEWLATSIWQARGRDSGTVLTGYQFLGKNVSFLKAGQWPPAVGSRPETTIGGYEAWIAAHRQPVSASTTSSGATSSSTYRPSSTTSTTTYRPSRGTSAATTPTTTVPSTPSSSTSVSSSGGGSGGCGSRGGPGYRLPNGKCASWRDARSGRGRR